MNKRIFIIATAALVAIAGTTIYGTSKEASSKIAFDKKAAQKHVISMQSANSWIKAFAPERAQLEKTIDLPISETFNRDAFAALLSVPGTESVRAYLGKKPNGEVVFIFKAVDKNGHELKTQILDENVTSSNVDGAVIENGTRCPSDCPKTDPSNP